MSDDDIWNKLRIDPAILAAPYVPSKIRKRREQFVQVPMWWIEKLGEAPLATGTAHQVACYLCHLDWKHHGKPFKLPNGMLEYDGISRYSKWRALAGPGTSRAYYRRTSVWQVADRPRSANAAMTDVAVRPLRPDELQAWHPLWQGYLTF